MNRKNLFVFLLAAVILSFSLFSFHNYHAQSEKIRVMFYNVENLFDTIDNPQTNDNEFLPDGEKRWNKYKYWQKLKKIYQVIAYAGDETPPDIIGFAEVESNLPLLHLTQYMPLSKFEYTIVHKDSPDSRGIDVALLCRKDRIKVLTTKFINPFAGVENRKTRDILLAMLKIEQDTIFVFVNHWPSRRGGEETSGELRLHVSEKIKMLSDSITQLSSQAKILIMGDFNDEPTDQSLLNLKEYGLVNISEKLQTLCKCGTYKFKSQWNMFDQVLVSNSFVSNKGMNIDPESLRIIQGDFMMLEDKNYGGKMPFRTYVGPRYQGGYSDHLPITIDINYRN